ncbi:hypothetical protein Tdes44962_MAKER09984 [Teratosphaeria destructans]|uniref:Uncharacterized protein n=1 Tax=Teratosphaeria destructans TaxID=418781 RepID=A0A9W7SQM4_9PEZI|nr:hypothetical protein Tdes44962_MAKER09984 [Teratosphaeria destructans]
MTSSMTPFTSAKAVRASSRALTHVVQAVPASSSHDWTSISIDATELLASSMLDIGRSTGLQSCVTKATALSCNVPSGGQADAFCWTFCIRAELVEHQVSLISAGTAAIRSPTNPRTSRRIVTDSVDVAQAHMVFRHKRLMVLGASVGLEKNFSIPAASHFGPAGWVLARSSWV